MKLVLWGDLFGRGEGRGEAGRGGGHVVEADGEAVVGEAQGYGFAS